MHHNQTKGLLTFIFLALASTTVRAEDILKDFDSLGGNQVLFEKAKELNPDQDVYIVQNRIVDRNKRFEFSPEYTSIVGGDSFLSSRMFGFNTHFHINPRWSLGAKYAYVNNRLSQDGENLLNDTSVNSPANPDGKALVPDIDFPKNEWLLLVNYYPIYGKLNILNKGIAHFDVYATAGAGQIELRSGRTNIWTLGGGIGFWISQHLTTRLELRTQNHKAQRFSGPYNVDLTLASIQVGYLL